MQPPNCDANGELSENEQQRQQLGFSSQPLVYLYINAYHVYNPL